MSCILNELMENSIMKVKIYFKDGLIQKWPLIHYRILTYQARNPLKKLKQALHNKETRTKL